MINTNTKVEIVPSKELSKIRLFPLVGRVGVVECNLNKSNRINKGYIIRIAEGGYLNEDSWYIPAISVKEINNVAY